MNQFLNSRLPPAFNGLVTFQGDAHGKLDRLARPGNTVIQVGDLGIGFVSPTAIHHKITNRSDLWFIRGNHDDPAACRRNSRYMGEWGSCGSLFFVSGAWSIDQAWRTEGRDWWHDEELSVGQASRAFDDYVAAKPRFMVTHDGPAGLFERGGAMMIQNFQRSATSTLLQAMLEVHAPEWWIFGHHHVSRDFVEAGTRFRCLAELESITLAID